MLSPRAASLLQKGCDGGIHRACRTLGTMYQAGGVPPRDTARAAALYAKACDAGDGEACGLLGVLQRDGTGVARDATRAGASFKKRSAVSGVYASSRSNASRAARYRFPCVLTSPPPSSEPSRR